MTEVWNEIVPETNKIYRTRFTFRIDKFMLKLNTVSRLDIEIAGLTTCRLEVHPSQRRLMQSGSKFTKLLLRFDLPKYFSAKPREVRFEIRTSQDIAIWGEKFEYDSSIYEKVKEEFFNDIYLRSYMEDDALVLNGIIIVKEMNWINDPMQMAETRQSKLVKDIHSLASSGVLSDFKFIVEGRELEVHKAILAARSPVFERMFTGNFREATAKEQEVKDVSADAFEEFLYFIYAGDLRNKDFPVEELIAIADRYQVTDLMRFCELKLLKSINDDNAEDTYRLANQIQSSNSELKRVAFDVLQSKFKKISVGLPSEFIKTPEKVYRSLELKKQLEESLKVNSESDETSDDNDETVLTESEPTLSSGISGMPSFATMSIQSIDEHINMLLRGQ